MKKRLICLCLCGIILFLSSCHDDDLTSTSGEGGESTKAAETEFVQTTIDPKYEKMTLEEKLIDVRTWEKEGHPQNLMVFDENGEGFIKNYGIFYKMSWELSENQLITKIEISEGLVPEQIYEIEMEDNFYILTNAQTKVSSKFYFEGTQSILLPKDGEKDKKVIGAWLPEDEELYGYLFSDDEGISGKFSQSDDEKSIISEFKWTVYDYQIYIYFDKGPQYVYEYMISGDTLIFYRKGKSNIVYHKVS